MVEKPGWAVLIEIQTKERFYVSLNSESIDEVLLGSGCFRGPGDGSNHYFLPAGFFALPTVFVLVL